MTTDSAERSPPVFAPEGFTDFQCDQCGDCCIDPARITISAAKCDRLARLLREAGFQFPVRDALMREREDDLDQPATFALVGDRCVFLTDASQCRLCELDVPELRGTWCISFPVTPITTPRGVNYSISFACRKTARILCSRTPLNILALNVGDALIVSTEKPFPSTHRVPTVQGRPELDWTAFRLVEGLLLAIARDDALSATVRLQLLPEVLGDLLDGYRGTESEDQLRERVSTVAQKLPDLVRNLRTRGGDPVAHYEALAAVFGRRIGLRTQARPRKLVENALRQVRGRRTKTKSSELGAAVAQLYAKYLKPKARSFDHILGNYIICRLFANRDMLQGGVYKGVYVVCYLVALIRFFAMTTASERNVPVGQDILLESIQTVEKLFAQSRTVFDFLDTGEEQQRMLDPAYAAALVKI